MEQRNGVVRRGASASEAAGITVEQEKAMGLMVLGKSVTEAAAGAGVGRTTLYRWLRDDPQFIAAWNAWRREQQQAARARLLGVAAEAVEAVREAVKKGDGKLALRLLEGMGMVTAEEPGSDDPELVAKQRDQERRSEEAKILEKEQELFASEILPGGRVDRMVEEGRRRG